VSRLRAKVDSPLTGWRRRALLLAPAGLLAISGSAFWVLLEHLRATRDAPLPPPNPLLGKRLPAFSLPGLTANSGFGNTDVDAFRRPVLLNFFASWCMPCIQEAPVLMQLAQRGLPIWGIDYQDRPDAAADFLRVHGDPYQRVACDPPGRVADDFGVIGVPESFLVDSSGVVRWRWAGGLSADVVARSLDPLLRAAS